MPLNRVEGDSVERASLRVSADVIVKVGIDKIECDLGCVDADKCIDADRREVADRKGGDMISSRCQGRRARRRREDK